MLHFLGCQELGFLDVDDRTGFGHGHHQVSLATQESRQLYDVADFRRRGSLAGLVHVRDDRYAILALDISQDLQPLVEAGAAEGVDG